MFTSPKRRSALPEVYFHSEDAMSFSAILVSIVIASGVILGACILVFVGIAAMAREARD